MKLDKPWLRALSGLSINIAAAWFVLAFITPNYVDITKPEGLLTLTRDVLSGILFLLTSVMIERELS